MSRTGEKIKLTNINELLGVENEESALEININQIHAFHDHPFKVQNDTKMQELVESIREKGVLTPVLVRPSGLEYEMISGHRRMYAAKLLGLEVVPAIIRDMTDDDAVIAMVDTNIQRDEILPSERAFAYQMKLEAMKHQGKTLGSGHNDQKASRDVLAEQVGESSKQIQRYIRLTKLIPSLLELVDEKVVAFTAAVDLSYLDHQVQEWVYEYILANGTIKPAQAALLKSKTQDEKLNKDEIMKLLNDGSGTKQATRKITLPSKTLKRYFPPEYTTQEMENVIIQLLEEWKSK